MKEVTEEAKHLKVNLQIVPTEEAIKVLNQASKNTNAVLHVTC